jgi:hypothetical protein
VTRVSYHCLPRALQLTRNATTLDTKQGYNGSQCWDTSFTVRAMVEGGLAEQFPECSRKIYSYLDRTQVSGGG